MVLWLVALTSFSTFATSNTNLLDGDVFIAVVNDMLSHTSSLTSSTSLHTLLTIINMLHVINVLWTVMFPFTITHGTFGPYTKLKWLLNRILSVSQSVHVTYEHSQNLNGLSIVFYHSHSLHMRRTKCIRLPPSVGLSQTHPQIKERCLYSQKNLRFS